jgi:hypothetical protein
MQKKWILLGVLVLVAAAYIWFSPFDKIRNSAEVPPTQTWECNMDAKICPDGSSVGRTGPKCEFTACPSPDATSSIVTTFLGGRATGLNFTVSPQEIISDSRCAEGVQCIWAGTVELRAIVETPVGNGEHKITLGKPLTVGNYEVTLTEVTPAPKAGEKIPMSSYHFTFEVKRI